MIAVEGVAQDITERKRAEEALRRLNERLELLVAKRTEDLSRTVARLQQMTWELSQTEDRERKRIADLLHDDVQQTLAGARFHLNLLSMETRSAEDTREIIGQVRKMLKEAIEKARNLSHELSPALYQVDLAEILNWLACHMRSKARGERAAGSWLPSPTRAPARLPHKPNECVRDRVAGHGDRAGQSPRVETTSLSPARTGAIVVFGSAPCRYVKIRILDADHHLYEVRTVAFGGLDAPLVQSAGGTGKPSFARGRRVRCARRHQHPQSIHPPLSDAV